MDEMSASVVSSNVATLTASYDFDNDTFRVVLIVYTGKEKGWRIFGGFHVSHTY